MGRFLRYAVCALMVGIFPLASSAETWVEFHSGTWNYKSQKLKKKLKFRNSSYYDADSLKRSAAGDVDVWVKEVSMNDRYYVGKGVPSSEDTFKKIHLWCGAGKYEILTSDAEEAGANEAVGEEVVPGTMYDKLFRTVCNAKEASGN
jgi:hypothetical protein